MLDGIENLIIISVQQRVNKSLSKIENRKTHSLFIRQSGAMLYDFKGEKIVVNEGELMFIPKGSSYDAYLQSENGKYTAIHFEADFPTPQKPRRYSLDGFYEAEYITQNIYDMWSFGTQAERYRALSLFYSLLSYLASEDEQEIGERKYSPITPALDYLKKHIYDSNLKVEELHTIAGISSTYFRQLFISKYGTTPRRFILKKRLSHAKSILAAGDFGTISEVALSVGFNDPLYFSKAYKKAYGISPTEMLREGY